MSEPNQEDITNGGLEKRTEDESVEIEGEESDDYEEIDEEEERQVVGDEDEEGEEEDAEKGQNTLTHLLLGNSNGATVENGADYDDEEDDDEEGYDDDDEYVEDQDEAAPSIPLTKKRSIDEVADEEPSQDSKKIKA